MKRLNLICQKAIELQPDYAEAYNNLVYKEMENIIRQKNEKAIELNPEYYEAYNNAGIIYNQIKNYKKAVTYVEYAKRLKNFPVIHNNMGVIKKLGVSFINPFNFNKAALKLIQIMLLLTVFIKYFIKSGQI